MHPNPRRRQEIICEHVSPASARMVEIGALNGPTFAPADHNVRFIDYATREQLIQDTAANPAVDPARIVHVHYATPSTNYADIVPDRFDIAIANHVIEHIPDLASWFTNIHAILDEGGMFFLSVPDKRYTFDYLKRETNIVDVVRAHTEGYTKPTAAMLFEHYYYRRPLEASHCWSGEHEAIIAQPDMSITDAYRHAVRASQVYTSTHCHMFTKDSFVGLLGEMRQLGFAPFDIADIRDVDPGANEFHVVLKRDDSVERIGRFAALKVLAVGYLVTALDGFEAAFAIFA